MKKEINQLERHKTWELVHPPLDANIINSGFTFHQKRNERGEIHEHKARFIGKGYLQIYGVDHYETFAPTVRMTSQ